MASARVAKLAITAAGQMQMTGSSFAPTKAAGCSRPGRQQPVARSGAPRGGSCVVSVLQRPMPTTREQLTATGGTAHDEVEELPWALSKDDAERLAESGRNGRANGHLADARCFEASSSADAGLTDASPSLRGQPTRRHGHRVPFPHFHGRCTCLQCHFSL